MFPSEKRFSASIILRKKKQSSTLYVNKKKVKEFREIANKIKQDIAFEWNANTDKLYLPDEKREAYINNGGIHHLDKEYTVFGEVIEGFDVIDKIAALPTDKNDRPLTDVRIKVRILNN